MFVYVRVYVCVYVCVCVCARVCVCSYVLCVCVVCVRMVNLQVTCKSNG